MKERSIGLSLIITPKISKGGQNADLGFQFCVYSKKACFYTIGNDFAK